MGGGDIICGGKGNDELHGSSVDDRVHGGDGIDPLFGGIALELLIGGRGADVLHGGANHGAFDGSRGNDISYGELSDDQLHEGFGGDDRDIGGPGTNRLVRCEPQIMGRPTEHAPDRHVLRDHPVFIYWGGQVTAQELTLRAFSIGKGVCRWKES